MRDRTSAYKSASTLLNRGAVHPSNSPGESGLDRGMVTSYLPVQTFGCMRDCTSSVVDVELSCKKPIGIWLELEPLHSTTRSSFSRCKAATNWMVDTNASRVGSHGGLTVLTSEELAASASCSEADSII
jgi:hypothetical protein